MGMILACSTYGALEHLHGCVPRNELLVTRLCLPPTSTFVATSIPFSRPLCISLPVCVSCLVFLVFTLAYLSLPSLFFSPLFALSISFLVCLFVCMVVCLSACMPCVLACLFVCLFVCLSDLFIFASFFFPPPVAVLFLFRAPLYVA